MYSLLLVTFLEGGGGVVSLKVINILPYLSRYLISFFVLSLLSDNVRNYKHPL